MAWPSILLPPGSPACPQQRGRGRVSLQRNQGSVSRGPTDPSLKEDAVCLHVPEHVCACHCLHTYTWMCTQTVCPVCHIPVCPCLCVCEG